MKTLWMISLMAALIAPARVRGADQEGVALAIIFDSSGSMREPVRDTNGRDTAKYIIAKRALVQVSKQLEAFVAHKGSETPRKLETGLYIFRGDTVATAIPFGPFDASAIQNWATRFNQPSGNTPLGNSMSTAYKALLNSPLARKHILIITDGMNTVGPKPAEVMPRLKKQADEKGAVVSTHFVAFDVAARVFDDVKKLGATVVSAADENQLNTQLNFIMEKKILLEDEEPRK